MAMVTAACVAMPSQQYRNACVTAPELGCYNVRDRGPGAHPAPRNR